MIVPLTGLIVSSALTLAFVGFHRRALSTEFQDMCEDRIRSIQRNIETNINLLRAVQAFGRGNRLTSWATLHEFVENFSLLSKDVARYYWWNPRIAPRLVQPLEAYPEDSSRVSFSAGLIQHLVTRAGASELSAAAFLLPRSSNESSLCILALPVSREHAPNEGVLLAFEPGRLIEQSVNMNALEGVELTVRDSAGDLLYRTPAHPPPDETYLGELFESSTHAVYSRQIPFADSVWSIRAESAVRFPDTDALACLGVFAFGLLLTVAIDAFVERRRREAAAMRGMVRRRSRELSEARDRLQIEIAEKESAEASLRESEDRFRKAYADAAVGMMMTDLEGHLIAVNRSACRLAGLPERTLLGKSLFDLLTRNDDRVSARQKLELLSRGVISSHHAECQIRRNDGQPVWLRVSVSVIESEARPTNFFALLEDITEQVQSRQQLEFQATRDALTGLINRRAFEDGLSTAIGAAQEGQKDLAVMYIDLDGFKFVNDSLGHSTGDLLLRKVAPRLQQALKGGEILARVGGDEFTVILETNGSREQIAEAAQRVLHCLRQPFEVEGHELFVSASIGISVFPDDGCDAGILVQHADAAMYRAKHEGRGRYSFFSAEMAESAAARLRMESDLRRATANNELKVAFQPLVRSDNGAITHFEALCRWRRGGKEYIPPARFIPVAEESGQIIPIGAWMIEESCRQAKRWNLVSPEPIKVAVNVSFVQLGHPGFITRVVRVLENTGLSPALLELELTESAVMRDREQTLQILDQLSGMGISLVLDDFGTGYSSLSHLQAIPLKAVKIDQSFIARIATSRRSAQLVSSLIALAHGLGLEVVGEGVELPEQAAALRSLNCDLLQGFLLGEPMDPDRAMQLVTEKTVTESLSGLAAATRNRKQISSEERGIEEYSL